ncbi:hypothetical protein [Streptomyces litmocidini]|uniref:hypothetical protein n=1 Tax=Streptomyces litmocidini TaxID=67318 RepID=UPI00167F0642|nr:hypothetical protein [Streptomyces litmocidini]
MIDAIARKFRTGSPWVRPPEEYGDRQGVANRYGKTPTLHPAGLHIAGVFLRSAGSTAQEQERTASSQAPGLR